MKKLGVAICALAVIAMIGSVGNNKNDQPANSAISSARLETEAETSIQTEIPVEEISAEETPAEEIPAEEIPVEETLVEAEPTELITEKETHSEAKTKIQIQASEQTEPQVQAPVEPQTQIQEPPLSEPESEPVTTSEPSRQMYATATVNVRSGAGTDYDILGTLNQSDSIDVQHIDGEWAQVAYGGITAYIASAYLSDAQPQTEKSEQSEQINEQMVWLSATGEKYHSIPNCGRMNPAKARQVTLQEAQSRGYDACSKCF